MEKNASTNVWNFWFYGLEVVNLVKMNIVVSLIFIGNNAISLF